MNYEERYNQALERAKVEQETFLKRDNISAKTAIERIFPELRESEDEQHCKWILEYLYDGLRKSDEQFKDQFKSAIAWLEKQGEQKTEIKYVYPKFRIGDVIEPIKPNGFYRPVRVLSIVKKTESYYCESDDKKSFSSIPIRRENEYKLVEQKPSWSEEDEKRLNHLIEFIQKYGFEYYASTDKVINWLKSLNPQNRWKPSEEQMQALFEAKLASTKNREYFLGLLYEDLKRL